LTIYFEMRKEGTEKGRQRQRKYEREKGGGEFLRKGYIDEVREG
jgi:hypothetical protein